MTGSRIGFLVLLFRKNGVDWRKGKSVFARELQGLMTGTDVVAPELLTPVKSLNGAPMPYEVEFDMANACDCGDWQVDNGK